MNPFDRLLRRLQLNQHEPNLFVGGAGEGGVSGNSRLFGGMVAAQATMAALKTVETFPLHSLHAYFLQPGRPDADIEFHVSKGKDGRNFAVCNVAAVQNDRLIFQLQSSFQRPAAGVHHQPTMPEAPDPDTCPNRDQLKGYKRWRELPIDVRMITAMPGDQPLPAEQKVWLGVNGQLPEDPRLHLAMVVYVSDWCLLDTAWRPHADQGELAHASLDHNMWFHRTPRFDDWLLYTTTSPAADGGRGLAFGHLFNRAGEHLVTTAQEGVLRIRQPAD